MFESFSNILRKQKICEHLLANPFKMSIRENEWFIKAPWGRICIIAWGNCFDPPVLLCHGGMDSAASFRPLVHKLPRNFYYIGMEFPGCGRSDRLPPGLMISAYDLVYSIDAVASHFRWNSFVFLGHSMGAYIGKLYNIACPDKLSKFIELDPINVIGIPPEHFSIWYQKFFTNYYENMDKYNAPKERTRKMTWNEAIDKLRILRGISESDAAATLIRWTEPAGDGFVRYTFDPRIKAVTPPALSPEHIKKLFTSTKTPTLNIVSAESRKHGLYRNTAFLLDESIYPARNFRCRIVDGGHDVHITRPDIVAPYIAQFLLSGLEGLDSKAKL